MSTIVPGNILLPTDNTTEIEVTANGAIVRGENWRIASGAGGSKKGGKSGGGGGSAPKEAPNSLRSRDTASVLYLIGEGEIEGFPNGDILRNTFLDEVPIQNTDGSLNFKDVQVEWRPGTQNQGYISGFSDVEAEVQVGVKVSKSLGAIVRNLNDANADAISIRLMVPQLQTINEKSGDVNGARIDFRIEVAIAGQNYRTFVESAIEGKTTSAYARSYRIPLPKPASNWQIRVTRLTNDSNSTRISDELYWQSYKSIIETKLGYPNSALFGIRINAEQFRQIPKASVRLRGLKLAVPSNYDPIARTYSGFWDRTFKTAYSNNPAWIFYDLVAETRYGAGRYINASQIDIDSLYAIAQYCDQLVPDGFGGWEPRFTCNAYIDSADEAYNVLNTLAGVFRGMIFWAGGEIVAVQDAPSTPVRLYTEAGVIQEVDDQGRITSPPFSYSGSSRKARHTVALVSYSDPNDFYRTKIEYVEDRDGIAKYGYRETQIVAFGCTSRSQANRVGRWLLYTERLETETVNFTVGSLGMLARPGEIIQIADPTKSGSYQFGGRLTSANTTALSLDRPVVIEAGKSYTLTLYRSDTGATESRTVTSGTGTRTELTVSPAFSTAPVQDSEWLLSANDLQPTQWRVLSVVEKSIHQYTITAVEHNPSKYGAIEQGLALQEIPITRLPNLLQRPEPPGNLVLIESLYESGAAGVQIKVDISFSPSSSPGIDRYQIEYQATNDPAGFVVLAQADPSNTSFTWQPVAPGIYNFRVQAINSLGVRSNYVEAVKQISGLQAAPADVTNFAIARTGTQAFLQWDVHPDVDVLVGGYFIIKFTPKTDLITWSDGFELPTVAGAASTSVVPLMLGTYLIKAVDSSGNQSNNFAAVSSTFAITQIVNVVETLTESPTFAGAKTNCSAISNVLQLASVSFFDSNTGLFDSKPGLFDSGSPDLFDSVPGFFDSVSGYLDSKGQNLELATSGVYEFSESVDLGNAYNCQIRASLGSAIAAISSFFDGKESLFDSAIGRFEENPSSGAAATLQIAISQDGTTFDAWQNFSISDYLGRAFKFRLLLNSNDRNTNILVDTLSVTIDMPDRDESGRETSTGNLQAIAFQKGFWTTSTPVIGVTLIGAQTGDYFVVPPASVTNTGFEIQVFNSSGVGISGRRFDWIARGFGQSV